jgi:hypothetical protein
MRKLARTMVALVAISTLGGCFHISQRALANGAALSRNDVDARSVVYGDRNPRAMRLLQSRMNIRGSHSASVQYPAFGQWYY